MSLVCGVFFFSFSFCIDACVPSACVTERGMACLASGVCVGFPVFYVIPGMCFSIMVGLGVDKKQKKTYITHVFFGVSVSRVLRRVSCVSLVVLWDTCVSLLCRMILCCQRLASVCVAW